MRRCEAGEIVDVERLLERRNRPATARRFTSKASMRFIPARRGATDVTRSRPLVVQFQLRPDHLAD
jgi:hypothetical protein